MNEQNYLPWMTADLLDLVAWIADTDLKGADDRAKALIAEMIVYKSREVYDQLTEHLQ